LVWLVILAAAAGGIARAGEAADEAARVVIVANATYDGSEALARYYARRRGIPEANIIALPMPRSETIFWRQFVEDIYNPLLARLIDGGWIDAVPGELRDDAGRMRTAPLGHRISYLVTMRGVPLRIRHDERLIDAQARKLAEPLRTNQAAVDSELALLARPGTVSVNGFFPNPGYLGRNLAIAEPIIRVARIDGPTVAACRRLIDSALEGERPGIAGRAYIDLGGPHAEGEQALRAAAGVLRRAFFDVEVDEGKALFAETDRFDAPAFYLGWYAPHLAGPMARRGFRFPPGAVAVHIHSFSAETLRAPDRRWVGPFVERGAAASLGNVFEPYLAFSHNVAAFVEQLSRGEAAGEAAFRAMPALSWQAIFVGDPLYRPFRVSLDEQLAAAEERRDQWAAGVILREANRREQNGSLTELEAWLAGQYRKHRDMAVALRLARVRRELGLADGVVRALTIFRLAPEVREEEAALFAEAARLLDEAGDRRGALSLYERLVEEAGLGPAWERSLLPAAIAAAESGGRSSLAKRWRARLAALKAAAE